MEQGLIKSIGLSNFSPQKIESFISDVKIRPAVNQVCLCYVTWTAAFEMSGHAFTLPTGSACVTDASWTE